MLSPEQRKQLRARFQTDLFWACREILDIPICEDPHRRLIEAFYPTLDPTKPFEEQTDVKEALWLGSRGSLKSSIAKAFVVQVIVAFPDVRIGFLSSTDELACMMVDGIREEFFTIKNGVRSKFQRLFPEVVFPAEQKQFGESGTFVSPGRKKYNVVPTCFAVGLRVSSSSIHADALFYDDPSSGRNSGPSTSEEARAKVVSDVKLAHAIVDPGGLHRYLGTIYADDDVFSTLREDPDIRVVEMPAFTIKGQSASKKLEDLTEADVDRLAWEFDSNGRERLTWKFLAKELRRDAEIFRGQYLIDSGQRIKITEPLIRSHVLSPQMWADVQFRQPPEVVSAWDLGYLPDAAALNPNSRSRDWTASSCGWTDQSRRTIVSEIIRGRWTGAQIAVEMARQARRCSVNTIAIEDTYLSWLQPQIEDALRSMGCETTRVIGIPRSNEPGLKAIRLNVIAAALHAEEPQSLWFAPTVVVSDVWDRLVIELTKPKLGSNAHDDLRDSLGHLVQQLQRLAAQKDSPDPQAELQARFIGSLRNAELSEYVYGRRNWEPGEPIPEPQPEPPQIIPGQGWYIN